MDGRSPERQGPPQLLTPFGALWRLVALPVQPREEQRNSATWLSGRWEGRKAATEVLIL